MLFLGILFISRSTNTRTFNNIIPLQLTAEHQPLETLGAVPSTAGGTFKPKVSCSPTITSVLVFEVRTESMFSYIYIDQDVLCEQSSMKPSHIHDLPQGVPQGVPQGLCPAGHEPPRPGGPRRFPVRLEPSHLAPMPFLITSITVQAGAHHLAVSKDDASDITQLKVTLTLSCVEKSSLNKLV